MNHFLLREIFKPPIMSVSLLTQPTIYAYAHCTVSTVTSKITPVLKPGRLHLNNNLQSLHAFSVYVYSEKCYDFINNSFP